MRHLSSHYQRKQTEKIIFLLIVLLVGFIFFINIGLKIILFTSSTVANLFLKKNNEVVVKPTVEEEPINVNIDNYPSATNSAMVKFDLSLRNANRLIIYLNNKKIKEEKVEDGLNEITVDNLTEGENEIFFQAENKKTSRSKRTERYQIVYKKTKPKLEVGTPKDGEKINQEEVKISGETDKETTITINHQPVIVNSLGQFEMIIKLKEGENSIEIVAEDIAGNIETKTVKVIYEKD